MVGRIIKITDPGETAAAVGVACSQGIEINSSYCGEVEQNGPLVGTVPLQSEPLVVFHGTRLTAVALTAVDDRTVAFLGTSRGHVKKVS